MKIWITGIVILSITYFGFLLLTIRILLLDMEFKRLIKVWARKYFILIGRRHSPGQGSTRDMKGAKMTAE